MVETPVDQPGGGQEMVAGWRSARDPCGPIAGPPSIVATTAAATTMIAPAKSARLRMQASFTRVQRMEVTSERRRNAVRGLT